MSNNNNTPIASCTGRITVIKDGKDGVGIVSADVIFAVWGNDKSIPDNAAWKTTYNELLMEPGKYLWTAVNTTYTNKKSQISGKRCLGLCDNFAEVTELYALGDSSTVAPSEGWKLTYVPKKGKWLWTKNRLLFLGGSTADTTPVCIGYFPNDGINGTKFTIKGTADGHYTDVADIKKYAWGSKYIVDKNTKDTPIQDYPCVYQFVLGGDNLSTKAAEGDAYIVNGDLWVNDGRAWQNVGNIQGAEGMPGEGAPWVLLSPASIVFNSDDRGVAAGLPATVSISIFLGSELITSQCAISLEGDNADASHYDISYADLFQGYEIATLNVKPEGIKGKVIEGFEEEISYPNSYISIEIEYEQYIFYATINITVDTSAVSGYFRTSIKGIEASYKEVKKSLDSKVSIEKHQADLNVTAEAIATKVSTETFDEELNTVEERFSTIEQTSEKISAKVDVVGDGLSATGIDIEQNKITLTSNNFVFKNNNDEETAVLDDDGKFNTNLVEAKVLKTTGDKKQYISIKDGLIEFFGTAGVCNIRFGINNDGMIVMSYYDNDGKKLYDLGPKGIDASTVESSSFASSLYVSALSLLGTENFYESKSYGDDGVIILQVKKEYESYTFGARRYADDDMEVQNNSHTGKKPFDDVKTYIALYKYTAARVNNDIVADQQMGLSEELAKKADGKYFTSGTIAKNGQLVNLANGIYFKKSEAVRDAPTPFTIQGEERYPAYCISMYKFTNGNPSGVFAPRAVAAAQSSTLLYSNITKIIRNITIS